jgi:site-specific recombinase XerD
LKVATRKGKQNVYHVDFPEDLMPELTEFLQDVRPRFPHADQQPYVFLTQKGRPHTRDSLYGQITEKVYLYSGGKRLYPHLMRTLFFSEGVHANKDINFLASALNIDPVTALRHYNEIRAEDVMKTLADFNRETLRPSPR